MATGSPQRKRRIRWLVLAACAAFAAAVVYGTLQLPSFECEVCLNFQGRSTCRTVQAATTAEARQAAITNACALLASGVTDTLACERSTPTKLRCGASK